MPLRPSIPVAALISRAFVVVLCAVCGWGTPYDSSVAEDWNSANPLVASGVDAVTRKALQPLANWDGVYFHHIAYHGYKQEQFHAFFPLMPLLMRCVRDTVLLPLHGILAPPTLLLVAGVVVSNVCFVVAAHLFHCLSRVVLHDDGVAYRAALLFCLTPAGVFMSALYSESLFSMLSFAGVLALCRQFHYPRQGSRLLVVHRSPPSSSAAPWSSKLYRGPWPAACCFALATAARSNGIVLCGYLVFFGVLKLCVDRVNDGKILPQSGVLGVSARLRCVAAVAAQCAVVVLPYAMFQWYGHYMYCQQPPELARVPLQFMVGDLSTSPPAGRPWCKRWTLVPGLYSFVQQEYWGNGCLAYYEWKQVPNFVLAMPMIVVTALATRAYFRDRFASACSLLYYCGRRLVCGTAMPVVVWKRQRPWHSVVVLPCVVHWAVLGVVAVLFMHVQVITRFLSACPALYWYLATLRCARKSWIAVLAWCVGYTVVGAVLFSLFYPWT